ncbi:MAG TPA: C2H2-type zinc finger protein [Nitrososphaeraceae archaeon]|nr:C2H2-type zinc finger protein [Nitrososphaeraceae archaeon]
MQRKLFKITIIPLLVKYYVDIVYNMNSTAGISEILTCPQCDRIFSTIDDLNAHQKSEQQDKIEGSKGL